MRSDRDYGWRWGTGGRVSTSGGPVPGCRDPGEEPEQGEGDAIGRHRIRIGPWVEEQLQPEGATLAEQALEAAQADLELAQATRIVGIKLVALATVGQEGALGDDEEGGHRHDQTQPVGLDRRCQRAVFPVPGAGFIVVET